MLKKLLGVSVVAAAVLGGTFAYAASKQTEDYIRAPMPPGFQVVDTELEGPVFADARGQTLYKWPKKALRNGDAGEIQSKPACTDEVIRVNAGLMSPYPGGLELPEVETRQSCAALWPPVLASADAKPVGKWTVVDRPDGKKQWAYDGWALYTSTVDKGKGDTTAASAMFSFYETGAQRKPVGPDANVPPQFAVTTTMMGRLVTTRDQWSVYTFDGDARGKSNCRGECLDDWLPILAAEYARPMGEWTTFERDPGVRQWAFRGKPVYRYRTDQKPRSRDGSDVPGWHNVHTQDTPAPPPGFVMKETRLGLVLGEPSGKTVYYYLCRDDAVDQLECDLPESPQVYRFTVCGGGDPDRCVKTFPYIVAPVGAKSGSRTWGTMYIDPKTGKRADAQQAGALHVWTFRGRPVYTFAGDKKPEDMNANSWGEFNGERNGFKPVVYRDLFSLRDE